jgi:malonate decarboxylase epsilon subunit
MSILFTFPGQGAQKAGMLHTLPEHPEVARALGDAGDALGIDPLTLDSADALESTVSVQLCLLIAGVAMARVLGAHGAVPDMVAGLSIGAYPAAVTAGALAYADALQLVALRARLMEAAYPSGYGMTAINGLVRPRLEPLIAQVHGAASPVYLANLNAPAQLVISGADAAMQEVAALALGAGATHVERLAVGVPSHCELFSTQAEQMQAAFAAVTMHRPSQAYISASAARAIVDPQRIAADLAANMARQVHWFDTARHCWERGARLALEMPSGAVLTKLSAPVFEAGLALSCDATRLDTLLALAGRERGMA